MRGMRRLAQAVVQVSAIACVTSCLPGLPVEIRYEKYDRSFVDLYAAEGPRLHLLIAQTIGKTKTLVYPPCHEVRSFPKVQRAYHAVYDLAKAGSAKPVEPEAVAWLCSERVRHRPAPVPFKPLHWYRQQEAIPHDAITNKDCGRCLVRVLSEEEKSRLSRIGFRATTYVYRMTHDGKTWYLAGASDSIPAQVCCPETGDLYERADLPLHFVCIFDIEGKRVVEFYRPYAEARVWRYVDGELDTYQLALPDSSTLNQIYSNVKRKRLMKLIPFLGE